MPEPARRPQPDELESTTGAAPTRRRVSPTTLGYLIGPIAFLAILGLMHFGYIDSVSAWLWLGIFIVVPVSNLAVDHIYGRRPSHASFHLRVAVQITTVTAVIYLTGWGPVLWGAYAFVALADIAGVGSWSWRPVALWSFFAMALGAVGIWQGWLPSRLTSAQATALSIMGVFILFFIVRMAGATMEQK